MSKLNLQIKSIAIEDMERIADFIAKDNIKSAYDLLNDFYDSFNILCLFPKMGCIRKDLTNLNVRFFQVKHNYIIVYNIENDTVCIIRVLSGYQEICNLL